MPGAILAHPFSFVWAFAEVFLLGHAASKPMRATGSGSVEFWVSGGMHARGEILVIDRFPRA